MFAAGDIVEWDEQKQFGKTGGQANVVAGNIISYLANKPLKKQYAGSPELIILTNGKVGVSASFYMNVSDSSALHQSSGAAYFPFLWGIVLGPWFVRIIKSKSLLLGFVRSKMG